MGYKLRLKENHTICTWCENGQPDPQKVSPLLAELKPEASVLPQVGRERRALKGIGFWPRETDHVVVDNPMGVGIHIILALELSIDTGHTLVLQT